MDKQTLQESKKLQKEINKLIKIAKCNYKTEIDKFDDYPCVIISGLVHIAESSEANKKKLPYYSYVRVQYPGTRWDPPEEDEVPIDGGEEGYFRNLNQAVAAACCIVVHEHINSHIEYLKEEADAKQMEEIGDIVW